mmetsp:Transcript_5784/g.5195  ORF Transcript_5784/g.5195 Transcript_5784/m.5195 type:complete len:183 (+) Transcript_5784:25-573(+)
MSTTQAPSWLRESDNEDSTPLNQHDIRNKSVIPNNTITLDSDGNVVDPLTKKKYYLYWFMKVISLLLCCLNAATAVIGLGSIHEVDESGKIYVGVYMFFFSILLFVFEAKEFYKMEWLDHFYSRNFGFLYTVLGKAFFVIFIAFLSFGLGDPEFMSFLTGLSLAGYGASIIALYLKYPELFD